MKKTLAFLVLVLSFMSGCAREARDDLGLREFLLNRKLGMYAKTNEVCYLSFGSKPGTNSDERVSIDPPQEFLQRFAGRHFEVRKASQYPNSNTGGKSSVKNPKTGIPDGIYTAEIVEWIDDTTARVKYSMYREPSWAFTSDAVAEKWNGNWQFKKKKRFPLSFK